MTPNRTHGGPKMRERAREEAGGVRGMVVGEKELALQQRVAAAPIERASTPSCWGSGADRSVPWSGQHCTVHVQT